MFSFGRMYDVEIPAFSRALAANEVICRLSAPADAVLLILEMWFGQTDTDDLNEPVGIEIVRLSTDGAGGATMLFKPRASGDPVFGGTGAAIDAGDWSTEPTVSDVLGGAHQVNLATGWDWSWTQSGPIIVSPSQRAGFRITNPASVSMAFDGGLTILEVGG